MVRVAGRLSAVLLMGVLAGLGAAVPGVAATPTPYPAQAPVCSVTPNPSPAESQVTVSGNGFSASVHLTVTGTGSAVVSNPGTTSDSSGGFSVTERVSTAGSAVFTVTQSVNGQSASCDPPVTVAQPSATATRKGRSQVGAVSTDRPTVNVPFTFSGCGYQPGSTVVVTDTDGNSYGSVQVGPDGCFHARITMTTAGCRTLVGTGTATDGATLVTTRRVCVEGLSVSRGGGNGAGSGNGGGLAFTGADGIGVTVLVGAGLLGAGGGLLARSRRRRTGPSLTS